MKADAYIQHLCGGFLFGKEIATKTVVELAQVSTINFTCIFDIIFVIFIIIYFYCYITIYYNLTINMVIMILI